MVVLSLASCKKKGGEEETPDPRVKFSTYAEYYPEDGGLVSLPVHIYDVDDKDFPVTAYFTVEAYNNVELDEVIALQDPNDLSVTFEEGDTEAPIYFYVLNNTELQSELPAIQFTLTGTNKAAAPIGKPDYTIVRITDDEKAPRLASGQYEATYTVDPSVEVQREQSGYFPLTLAKIGKYEYVAFGWFGVSRPRLIGTFDPEAQTLTFSGKDYDQSSSQNEVSAFGQAYYYNSLEMDEVLVFRGAGSDGKQPIVIETDLIGVNETGYITVSATDAGFDRYEYDKSSDGQSAVGAFLGVYDQMPVGTTFKHLTLIEQEKYEEEEEKSQAEDEISDPAEVIARSLQSTRKLYNSNLVEIEVPFRVVE